MTFKFNMPKRFDAKEAATGVPHRITDEKGNFYGTYITSLFDPHSKFIQVEAEKYRRKSKTDPNANGEHAHIWSFVQICFQGWQDVPLTDAKGKALEFSKEAAFALLTQKSDDEDEQNTLNWLRDEIIKESRNVLNYQGDPEAEKDEVAKN
ncbi:hypothetical protein [Sphingomonas oryzagri]